MATRWEFIEEIGLNGQGTDCGHIVVFKMDNGKANNGKIQISGYECLVDNLKKIISGINQMLEFDHFQKKLKIMSNVATFETNVSFEITDENAWLWTELVEWGNFYGINVEHLPGKTFITYFTKKTKNSDAEKEHNLF